jgi:pimeloyl-ACP methyl ester carboxylesterase
MSPLSVYRSNQGQKALQLFYDDILANWPLPFETEMLSTRHGRTFVIACGCELAPPLILLHGSASNAGAWRTDVLNYSKTYRVYAVDMPGEPGKSALNRPSWHNLDFAEWLQDVLNGLQIQRAAFVGMSQGAWAAIRFASCYPKRVQKLVLMGPGGIVPARKSFVRKAIFYSLFGSAGVKRIRRMIVGDQPLPPDTTRFMDLTMKHFKARIEKEYIFTDEELEQLNMPVLFIGGLQDAIRSSTDIAARLEKLIPQFKALLLPEQGHVLINLTEPVIDFLADELVNA